MSHPNLHQTRDGHQQIKNKFNTAVTNLFILTTAQDDLCNSLMEETKQDWFAQQIQKLCSKRTLWRLNTEAGQEKSLKNRRTKEN